MPRLSDTMEEGTLATWHKQVGDKIQKGDVVAEIETDKALMDLEAYESGVLEQILVGEGETVPIGTPVAVVGTGEGAAAGGAATEAAPQPAGTEPQAPAQAPAPAEGAQQPAAGARPAAEQAPTAAAEPPPGAVAGAGERVKASPMARAIAREQGIDLASVTGSGPGGRIVKADVEAAAGGDGRAAAPVAEPAAPAPAAPQPAAPQPQVAAGEAEEIPVSSMRKVIARRLVESMQSTPHFYLTVKVEADELLRLRADLNQRLAAAGEDVKVSVNDLLIKAAASTLRANPDVNVSWAGDKILRHQRVNVGFAAAVEAGLLVPVVHDADTKSITQISKEAKALVAKARAGKLTPAEMSGGTFTISNLGMFGIDQFTAVINPPEAAILAVGATTPDSVVSDGELVIRQVMKLTLAIDHRPLDGATGARFLQQLKGVLEEPLRILA
jgi:pyruvate dehydrogenase E2 component (dihydrolipoamide acetyltransferase)